MEGDSDKLHRVRVRVRASERARARVSGVEWGVGVGVRVRVRARGRKDAFHAHLEEGVQVMGQLGVTACVSTPLWQNAPQTARGVDPQAVSVPDTTPTAMLRFAWKSAAMARATRTGAQSAGATASACATFGKKRRRSKRERKPLKIQRGKKEEEEQTRRVKDQDCFSMKGRRKRKK